MADKIAVVQGKITAFIGLTKESLDGASDALDGDREIKRRLIGKHNMGCGELLLQDNCFCKAMAVSQAFIFHFKCNSISPYASFYAGLSCSLNYRRVCVCLRVCVYAAFVDVRKTV